MDQSGIVSYPETYLTPPMEKTDEFLTIDDIYSSTPDNQTQQNQLYNPSTALYNPVTLHTGHQYSVPCWSDKLYSTDLNQLNVDRDFEENVGNLTTDSLSPTLPQLYLSESSSGFEPNSRLSNNECGLSTTTTTTTPTTTTAATRSTPGTGNSTTGITTSALDYCLIDAKSSTLYWNLDGNPMTSYCALMEQPPVRQRWTSDSQHLAKPNRVYQLDEQKQHQHQHQTHAHRVPNLINPNIYGDMEQKMEITSPSSVRNYTTTNHWSHDSNTIHSTVPKHSCLGEDTFHYQLVDPKSVTYYTIGSHPESISWDNLQPSPGPCHNYHFGPTLSGTDCHRTDLRCVPDSSVCCSHLMYQSRNLHSYESCFGNGQYRPGDSLRTQFKPTHTTMNTSPNTSSPQNNYTILYPHLCPNQYQEQQKQKQQQSPSEYVSSIPSSSKHYIINSDLQSPNKHYCLDKTRQSLVKFGTKTSPYDSSSADRLNRSSRKRHWKRCYSFNRSSDTSSSQHTFDSCHQLTTMTVKSDSHHPARHRQHLDLDRIRSIIPPGPADGCLKWLQNSHNLFRTLCIHRGSGTRAIDFTNRDSMVCDQIQFRLRDFEIWAQMCVHDTEMIATNMGRRIFPSLSVDVFGLNPVDEYIFVLDMILIQPHVFKHQNGKWMVSAQPDEPRSTQTQEGQIYIQEDSPKSGAYWMESGVNFIRAKITNSKEVKIQNNMIHVHSMQYYLPRFTVIRVTRPSSSRYTLCKSNTHFDGSHDSSIHNQYDLIGCYVIPGTQFYTVTAYQNPDVIRIKINNNPFAKGFRNRQDNADLEDAVLSAMRSNFTDSTKIKFA